MPISPEIVSANVSNVKIDGEIVPGLQYLEYNIDGQQRTVSGTLKVRSVLPKVDSVIVNGQSKTHSFQVVVEIKKGFETLYTLSFDECYFESTSFSMNAIAAGTSEYRFRGSKIRDSRAYQGVGTSIQRPKTNEVKQKPQVKTPVTVPTPPNSKYSYISTSVVKRDGQAQTFSPAKLESSIVRAGASAQEAKLVSNRVINRIGNRQSISSREVSTMTARSLSRINTAASRNYAAFRTQKNPRSQ